MINQAQPSSQSFRKARTRTLIQLGALIEKVGILEILGITPGADIQKDTIMQLPVALLAGALSELAHDLREDTYHRENLILKGLNILGKSE